MSSSECRDEWPDDGPVWAVFLPLVPFCIFLFMLSQGVAEPVDKTVLFMGALTWARQLMAARRRRVWSDI
jgi:hypothetical protein